MSSLQNRILATALLIISILSVETASAQKYQGEKGSAKFISEAALNSFEGVSSDLNGLVDLKSNFIDFYLDLNTLETGISLRDKHMRKNYLETDKYPFAEFTGKFQTLKTPSNTWQEVLVVGEFKVHGVTKQLSIKGRMKQEGQDLIIEAAWKLKLSDYNIEIPSVVFYELNDEQKIELKMTLKPAK